MEGSTVHLGYMMISTSIGELKMMRLFHRILTAYPYVRVNAILSYCENKSVLIVTQSQTRTSDLLVYGGGRRCFRSSGRRWTTLFIKSLWRASLRRQVSSMYRDTSVCLTTYPTKRGSGDDLTASSNSSTLLRTGLHWDATSEDRFCVIKSRIYRRVWEWVYLYHCLLTSA